MSTYTIDPLNERCRVCDRRIGLLDDFVPAEHSPGIVHARCSWEEEPCLCGGSDGGGFRLDIHCPRCDG